MNIFPDFVTFFYCLQVMSFCQTSFFYSFLVLLSPPSIFHFLCSFFASSSPSWFSSTNPSFLVLVVLPFLVFFSFLLPFLILLHLPCALSVCHVTFCPFFPSSLPYVVLPCFQFFPGSTYLANS